MIPVENIPACLKRVPHWVGWKYIERDGKPTKCPVNPETLGTADSTDPATWSTFEQAMAAYQSDSLAGVGFVFTAEAQLCGVDLDDSVDPVTGKLKPWAHPKVRWREADIEQAIIKEWERFRFPDPATADWYREAVQAAFEDVGSTTAMRRKMLTKRRTELTNMQDRLLNGYLAGTIDEPTFQLKSADLKSQLEDVECQLDEADEFDPAFGQTALAVFDFSQNLVPLWRGSNSARKRTILEVVSLNRTVSDVSLVLTKRRPFDFLVERPFLKKSRGDWI